MLPDSSVSDWFVLLRFLNHGRLAEVESECRFPNHVCTMPASLPSQRRSSLVARRKKWPATQGGSWCRRWWLPVFFALAFQSSANAQAFDATAKGPPREALHVLAGDLEWLESTRTATAEILSAQPTISLEGILLELLNDRDRLIRRDALEALTRIEPSHAAIRQVALLADRDPDPLCQAKARLFLAEFSATVPQRLPDDAETSTRLNASRELERVPLTSGRLPARREQIERPIRHRVHTADFRSDDPSSLRSAELVNFDQLDLLPLPSGPHRSFPQAEESEDSNDFHRPFLGGITVEPGLLDRPLGEPDEVFANPDAAHGWPVHPLEAPLGYTGKSGILPVDVQQDGDFVPVPDRWRSGFPAWDRYGKGHPPGDDYPYKEGHWWDPYNQNVLKGDYPIVGQHTFLKLTGRIDSLQEYRQLPAPTTPFESTVRPNQRQFFGDPNEYFTTNFFRLTVELFHGDAGFKPVDWSVRVTPVFNFNYLDTQELGLVNPDVRKGTNRYDDFLTLEEYFVEAKLKDLSPDYDFLSLRVGSQPFTSDFRGFIFSDTNRAVRLFGTRLANRDQFNVAFFRQAEKDTNSQLNTLEGRDQSIAIANYYRQDFLFPGYTAQASVHYNNDGPSFLFDHNDFLARPDPVGVFRPHRVEAVYLGLAGDGHIGRINVSNAFYWVTGRDSLNPIGGAAQSINAAMAAAEVSYDRDWIRFRSSFFYASGDRDPYDCKANGFDSILDSPNFAGGQFSYWQRQQINLQGVGLVNRFSLVPDLRSSKFEGQSNFVNPGLRLLNVGADFELTQKTRLITNASYLEFDSVRVLQAFTFQNRIQRSIGVDLSIGMEYRPLLSDNIIVTGGYACLIPGAGFKDLYGTTSPFTTASSNHTGIGLLNSAFMQLALAF